MRVLVGSDITITSPVFVGADGETPTPCGSLPTITVTNSAGTVLAAPTAVATDPGVYTAVLSHSAHTASLDRLTVVFAGTADGMTQRLAGVVNVVDDHYASIAELRAIPDLADKSRFPSFRLQWARDGYAELVERYRGASWVGRATVETISPQAWADGWKADGTRWIGLRQKFPRQILAVTVDGTPLELTGSSVTSYGYLSVAVATPCPIGHHPIVTVAYTYGITDGILGCLRDGCREYVRALLQQDTGGLPQNAYSLSDGNGGTYRLSTADWDNDRPTGYLPVDAPLNMADDYRHASVGAAT